MAEADVLTCRELAEEITAYLENALSSAERLRLEAHLAICGDCNAYLDQMRRTIALTGTLHEEDVPPEAQDRLLAIFRAWKAGGEPGHGES